MTINREHLATQKILDLILDECRYWQGRDEARRGSFAILYAKAKEISAQAQATPEAEPVATVLIDDAGEFCFSHSDACRLANLAHGTALYTAPPASADAVSVPVALMELEWLEGWLRFAAEPIGQECCGRGGQECCGCPDPVYPCLEDVGRAMDERAKELRALLAQSESQEVKQ